MNQSASNPNLYGQIPLGMGVFAATGAATLSISFVFWQAGSLDPVSDHLFLLGQIFSGRISLSQYIGYLKDTLQLRPLSTHIALTVLGLTAASYLGFITGRYRDIRKHVRGNQYYTGKRALKHLKKALRAEIKSGDAVLKIHPELPPITHQRLTRGLLLSGSTGSGKTQTIFPIILEALRDPAALIFIYCNKGEFSAAVPGLEDGTTVLIAPWDERGLGWRIAIDINTPQRARLFARYIVTKTTDEMWSNGARIILASIIVLLQIKKKRAWGFADILAIFNKTESPIIVRMLCKHSPEVTTYLKAHRSRTAESIRVVLASYLAPIADLARAWPNPKAGFSIEQWLRKNSKARTIIVQGSEEFSELRESLSGAVMAIATSIIASPTLPESNSTRFYFFVDEFPQLGKIPEFIKLAEVGRSKGVVPIFGFQDISQVRQVYGEFDAQLLMSSVGTHIVCRVQPGDTAEMLSDIIGDREVEIPQMDSDGKFSYRRTTEKLLLPSELTSLKTGSSGIESLYLGFGDVYRVTRPIQTIRQFRPPVVIAKWTTEV